MPLVEIPFFASGQGGITALGVSWFGQAFRAASGGRNTVKLAGELSTNLNLALNNCKLYPTAAARRTGNSSGPAKSN